MWFVSLFAAYAANGEGDSDDVEEINCCHAVPSFVNILSNLGLSIAQFLVAGYLIKNTPLSRKSPIYLFIFSLFVEAVDNALDTIAFTIYFIDQVHCSRFFSTMKCLLYCIFWPLILLTYCFKLILLSLYQSCKLCTAKQKKANQTKPEVDQNQTPQPILSKKTPEQDSERDLAEYNTQSGPQIQEQVNKSVMATEIKQTQIRVPKKINNDQLKNLRINETVNSNKFDKTTKRLRPKDVKESPGVILPAINAHKNKANRGWSLSNQQKDKQADLEDQNSNDFIKPSLEADRKFSETRHNEINLPGNQDLAINYFEQFQQIQQNSNQSDDNET
eukprot:403344136